MNKCNIPFTQSNQWEGTLHEFRTSKFTPNTIYKFITNQICVQNIKKHTRIDSHTYSMSIYTHIACIYQHNQIQTSNKNIPHWNTKEYLSLCNVDPSNWLCKRNFPPNHGKSFHHIILMLRGHPQAGLWGHYGKGNTYKILSLNPQPIMLFMLSQMFILSSIRISLEHHSHGNPSNFSTQQE